jgi:membrane protease YdiL (CAAX protease family)
MEQRQPLSFPKVTALIAGLFLRRFGNRMTAGLRRKGAGARTGTGRKAVGSPLGLMAIVVVFIFASFNISSQAMRTLASELGPPHDAAGRVEIHSHTYRQLRDFTAGDEPHSFVGDPLSSEEFRRAGHELQQRPVDELELAQIFLQETGAGNPESRANYAYELIQSYEQKGIDAFAALPGPLASWLPRLFSWRDPAIRSPLIHALGLILLILAGARHCWTLGSRNQDLGQVEWSTEWLFTLPASSRTLFGAQILGHAFVDPFSWIGAIPLLLVIYFSTGARWASAVPAALCNSIYLSLIMASLRVASETWLRKHLAPARLKNLQALFTLMGIVLLFLLFALARSQDVIQWVVRLAQSRSPLLLWNPFSIPAAAFSSSPALVAAWELLGAAVILLGSISLCSFLVRDGLVTAPAAYSGDRKGAVGRDFLPSGIVGKDLRLLLRDRNFFVQTLVAPALIVCFQVVFNVGMAQSIGSNYHLAATFAFAVGAYVMISTGLNVLAVEGNSLWMLYGLPVPLPAIMLRKTMLWAGLGLCYAVAVLAVCGWHIHHFYGVDLSYTTVALAGVVIYSFIASGMGMLATDPLEVEVKRRIRPGMIYLYMILASLYGYALYAPSTWARLGQIVLSSLLAYALWQKVRDRAPFLLDAVSMPPPRVSLADGLMAALGFFVLQGLFSILFLNLHMPFARTIVLAFAAAGALVVAFTLFMFWRSRVVGVLSAIGLRGPRDGRRMRAVFIGLAMGAFGGIAAYCYLLVIRHFPQFERLRGSADALACVRGWWLALLAVIAAPLFEEFIFRGLVFRGMRRSLPARWSIAGSAAVFAICHPPISVVPVFVMGVLAALGFEVTGWIVTPICVHMTYNGLVLLTSLLQHGGNL